MAEIIPAGTILQGRYLIEKQIGTGGMGRVYRAVDRRFENRVAIKETFYKDENLREAFEREARLLNGLHHPVLPHVSDYFTEGSEYFLVMEYIEGDDLHEILKRDGAFQIENVLRWSKQMLDALDYLHSQNPPIIHRDIKPQNLKITTRGDVVLLDFGLAKLNADDATKEVSVFGYSRAYSPLEQIQGTGTDPRSDIFALAATVYHLLTGQPPVDVLSRAAAIIGGNPDPLQSSAELRGEIPLRIDRILQKALSLNPFDRFNSAKEVLQTLKSALNEPVSITDQIIADSSKTGDFKDFPALQEFAKNAADSKTSRNASIESEDRTVPISNPHTPRPTFADSANTFITKSDLAHSGRGNLSWMMIGILTAVVLGGSFALWQFAGNSKASTETPSAVVSDAATVSQTDAVSPKTETADILPETNSATTNSLKTESLSTKASGENDKKTSENRQTAVRAEPDAKTKTASAPKNSVEAVNPVDERPRIVKEPRRQEEPLPDIEQIFTGQTRQQRAEQKQRQAQREERRRERREQRRRIRERIDDDWELPPRRRRNN